MTELLAQAATNGADSADWLGRILALLGALFGLATAWVTYASARRVKPYEATAGSNLATAIKIEAPEPHRWRERKFPDDWASEDARRMFWKKMRRESTLAYVVAWIICFLGFLGFTTNFLEMAPIWLFYSILSIPYIVGAWRRMVSLGGEPWKELTLRGKTARLVMSGTRRNVLGRCLAALHAIGGVVVSYDGDEGMIIGATGREAWWYVPERVEIKVTALEDKYQVDVGSDDPGPAPAALLKPNLANVRRLVAELSASARESDRVELHDTPVLESAGVEQEQTDKTPVGHAGGG
jgi:hypothetical protein